MKIYAFHLLNDFSGSPKVLSQVIKGLSVRKQPVSLVTSLKNDGFLSNIPGVEYIENGYVFRQNPIFRLWTLFSTQLFVIFKMYRQIQKEDVIYINTVLPFGAAILGKIKGCKVVYHLHETSMKPAILKWFLFFIVKTCSTEVIYVSNFLREEEPLKNKSTVIYNALENEFYHQAKRFEKIASEKKQVLMICSLKAYKGVWEFLSLASQFPKYDFHLVVNATQVEIEAFFAENNLPENLTVYPRQSNVKPFYQNADVVLNLSRPDQWVETFGLTAIEAMAYGIPVIVPPVGGIAELVEDGVTGFKVSSYESTNLNKHLVDILENEQTYSSMRKNCLEKATTFSEDVQIERVLKVLFQD